MKVLTIFIAILCSTLVFAAEPPLGAWEWTSTEEMPGEFTTPGSVGYTLQREFLSDFTYNEYRNETLYRSGQYSVEDVEYLGVIIPALRINCAPGPIEACAYYFSAVSMELYWGADSGGWPSFPLEALSAREPVATPALSLDGLKSLYR